MNVDGNTAGVLATSQRLHQDIRTSVSPVSSIQASGTQFLPRDAIPARYYVLAVCVSVLRRSDGTIATAG